MDLTPLKNILQDSGIFAAITTTCVDEVECFLVGGAIRDYLNGKTPSDFDFCFSATPTEYARRIAEKLGATFFILDGEREHSRLVLKDNGRKITCDFAPFRAPSLESDLHKRDFTVNAMAVACGQDLFGLIDPLQGQDDLADKQLKACSEYTFQDDPLRCLKGIRHAVCMDFAFDPGTMNLLVNAAPQIDQVASERIRKELAQAVGSERPVKAFELLGETGLAAELFGPASPEAFSAALGCLEKIDAVIRALRCGACGQVVSDYLEEPREEDVSVGVALRMAAFFYGYRPVALKSVLQALRFSKRSISLVEQLMSLDDQTAASLEQVANKPRSRARWLAGTGREPLASALFLPLVSPGEVRENLLQAELLIDSFDSCSSSRDRLGELVDGSWLTDELGVSEGPEIGRLQGLVHAAEISGEVTTTEEARQWLLAQQKSIDSDSG